MPECPFCKEKVGPNDFLPSEGATCSACGNRPLAPPSSDPWWLSAPPLQSMDSKTVSPEPKEQAITPPPEPTKPEITPTATALPPPPPRMIPGQSRLPPRKVTADHDDDEPSSLLYQVRNLDFGSALAFLCFSVALLLRSFDSLESFLKPIAALGLLAGLLGGAMPALWRRRNAVLPLLLSILCLLVLLFVGSWPGSSSRPPALVMVPLKQNGMAVHQVAGPEDWVDASANAVRRGDVRVQIVSVQIGPVALKRQSSTAPSTERFLTIHVRASYEGIVAQQTPYEPWAERAESPSKNPPTLTDNQGRTSTQKTFDPDRKVVGRADRDALNPGHQVKEVLVYPVPARDVEYLRLMLPASAFGLTGEFRFQIPRSMIRGL